MPNAVVLPSPTPGTTCQVRLGAEECAHIHAKTPRSSWEFLLHAGRAALSTRFPSPHAGSDVTRKVTTLARECGQLVSPEDIPTESLVPESMRSLASPQEFMSRLHEVRDKDRVVDGEKLRERQRGPHPFRPPHIDLQVDEEWEHRVREADERGEVLRYVGSYDGESGLCKVRAGDDGEGQSAAASACLARTVPLILAGGPALLSQVAPLCKPDQHREHRPVHDLALHRAAFDRARSWGGAGRHGRGRLRRPDHPGALPRSAHVT